MSRRFVSLIALFTAITLGLPYSSQSLAQSPRDRLDRSVFDTDRPQFGSIDSSLPVGYGVGGAKRSGPIQVVIELEAAPATDIFADAQARSLAPQDVTAAVQGHLAQINRVQQQLVGALQRNPINADVIYRVQRVYNGIAVTVDSRQLAQIRQLPGVKAIHPLPIHTRDNASGVPLIGAPDLWDNTVDGERNTGLGITIGIIDTGIDYLHTDFGGPGTGYDSNNTTIITDDPFPTAKVVGGYDFVGDDYNASSNNPAARIPNPDPDPMDCNGHGTHVAGTAAGFGVKANGDTYTGSYDPGTPFDTLRIGPGVAPQALLYALQVFGCDGSTTVTDQALEWAVDPNADGDFSDHLDVVNMSLGSQYGGPFDTTAIASDNAAKAGVVVVASAGNSGDTFYITGSPGSSGRTISVASSVDSTTIIDGIRADASDNTYDGVYAAARSVRYDFDSNPPVTGELVYPPSQRSGCQPFSAANAALISGKVVLLDWTDAECGSVTRGANARAAGAIGFILVDNSEAFDLLISGDNVIPGYSMPKPEGDRLKAALAAGTVEVTLGLVELFNSVRFEDDRFTDTISAFSSRGPRRGDTYVKPDISAPGQSIFSAEALSGNQGVSFNGTSMAAPHVAGAMALLRQDHDSWSVEELKALAMNTATSDVRSQADPLSAIFGPQRAGAGRITLEEATDSRSLAYNADEPGIVSVSFGAPEVVNTANVSKSIRVVNKNNTPRTYAISYEPRVDMPGVEYQLSHSTLTLGGNGFGNIDVSMVATAANMKHTHDPTLSKTQGGLPRHWMSEESGYVVLDPSSGPTLRVPVYAAPRPASLMQAASNTLNFDDTTAVTDTIALTGQPVLTGTNIPTDIVSIATAFELQHISPDGPNPPLLRAADLKYVGVSSDYPATGAVTSDTLIYFGIATHDQWETPTQVEFDIYIDVNRDGTDDYVLLNFPLVLGNDLSDIFVSYLVDLNTGTFVPQDFLNGLPASVLNTQVFNSSVMALGVFASDLGLGSGNTRFNYRVVSYSIDNTIEDDDQTAIDESIVDQTPLLSYDIARPGVDVTGGIAGIPGYFDLPGEEIEVRFDADAFRANESAGILLLHHHNTAGRQSEIVTITGALSNFPYKLYLPEVFR